jgi:hypothetical protein
LHDEVPPAHLAGVTVSMRVMSAGDGYEYLLQSVAAGDGHRSLTMPLIAYYAEKGTQPGHWTVPASTASPPPTGGSRSAGR